MAATATATVTLRLSLLPMGTDQQQQQQQQNNRDFKKYQKLVLRVLCKLWPGPPYELSVLPQSVEILSFSRCCCYYSCCRFLLLLLLLYSTFLYVAHIFGPFRAAVSLLYTYYTHMCTYMCVCVRSLTVFPWPPPVAAVFPSLLTRPYLAIYLIPIPFYAPRIACQGRRGGFVVFSAYRFFSVLLGSMRFL